MTTCADQASSLDENLVHFCQVLRDRGVAVTPVEQVGAASALLLIDLADQQDFYWALRITLLGSQRHQKVFDELFWPFWRRRLFSPQGKPADQVSPRARGQGELPATLLQQDRAQEPQREKEEGEATVFGYSPQESLMRKSFSSLSEAELAEMELVVAEMALRISARKSRRMRSTARPGLLDLRRSLRRALTYGGEFVELAHRTRRIEKPQVVFLCDVSGSMDRYYRFLLLFLLALQRVMVKVETFAFSTSLTHLTEALSRREIDIVLDQLSREVRDWSGGTRIGECLYAFLTDYGNETLGRRAVVVILSDGLDRGDLHLLEEAMRNLRRKARRIIWLNPLLEDPEYQPLCRGMVIALPFVDQFGPAHNLESLLKLVGELRP